MESRLQLASAKCMKHPSMETNLEGGPTWRAFWLSAGKHYECKEKCKWYSVNMAQQIVELRKKGGIGYIF